MTKYEMVMYYWDKYVKDRAGDKLCEEDEREELTIPIMEIVELRRKNEALEEQIANYKEINRRYESELDKVKAEIWGLRRSPVEPEQADEDTADEAIEQIKAMLNHALAFGYEVEVSYVERPPTTEHLRGIVTDISEEGVLQFDQGSTIKLSSIQHVTPSPDVAKERWEWEESSCRPLVQARNIGWLRRKEGDWYCTLFEVQPTSYAASQHIQLMTAAPELADKLRKLVNFLGQCEEYENDTEDVESMVTLLRNLGVLGVPTVW